MGNIKFLGNVTPDAVQFVNAAGTETGRIGKSGDDLTITNAVGDILFGDGTSDVYIGNGLASVDILFEQNGSIRSATGSSIALTLGSSDTTLNVYDPQMANGMTLTSTMTMGSSSLINFTPATGDVMQFSGQSIIKRLNANGGIRIGHDDQVIIAGGDTSSVLEANISGEVIALGAEQGVKIFSWQDNDTTWSNREQWQFTDKMYFGQNSDTNLYRLSANRLQTDGNFLANRMQSAGTQQNQFYSTYADGGIIDIKPSDTRAGKQPIIQYRNSVSGSVNYFMASGTSTFFGTYDSGVPSDESGMIKITPENTAEAPYISIGDSGSGDANLKVGGNVKITNSGVSYLNGGNVGIGTTSPQTKLQVTYTDSHVSGDLAISNSAFDIYNNSSSDVAEKGSTLTFSDNYLGTNKTTRAAIKGGTQTAGNTADGFLAFYTDSAGANSMQERMRIKSNGNVGIGAVNPGYKLEVDGGPINIVNGYSDPGSEAGYRLKFGDNGGIANDSGIGLSGSLGSESLWINKGSANGSMRFLFGTLGEKVTFKSTGNVGIGTTAPDSLLELENSPAAQSQTRMLHIDNNPTSNQGSGYMEISSGTNGQAKTQIEQVSSGGFGLLGNNYLDTVIINRGLSSNAHGNIGFATGSSTSATSIVMTIGGGAQKGNVGIGTRAPQSSLQVAGGVQMANDTDAASADKVGTQRYRSDSNNSYVDMCMQTGAATYEWVNIVQNNW